jgi:hypothetical protein
MKRAYLIPISFFAFFISMNNGFAKDAGFSFDVPDSLKKNADAVYLFRDYTYTRTSKSAMKENYHMAVTILSDRGDDDAHFVFWYDKFSSIDKIVCTIYDSAGKKVRKIKNSDIRDYAAYDGFTLFSDNRLKQFKALNPSYPYTIELEVETIYNGFIGLPTWYPLEGYNEGVKEASLVVKYPVDFPIQYKESNFTTSCRKEFTDGNYQCVKWSLDGIKAVEYERYAPRFNEQVPTVFLSSKEFDFDNSEGGFSDWNSLGAWNYSLLETKYELSVQTKATLDNLKNKYTDKHELAEQVYKFMQSRTRYVGIQLGIGGLKPFSPEVVDKVGYGDCKALSYYTKSLLAYVGIPSEYTVIGVNGRKILFDTFASVNQMNHAILCVPFETDTVWLECTSQTAPFNHLFEGSTGRKALLVTEQGGKIVTTSELLESKKENKILIKLNGEGAMECDVETSLTGSFYDEDFGMLQLSDKELRERLLKESTISDISLQTVAVSQNEKIPELKVTKSFTSNSYATKAGTRMFVEMSSFGSVSKIVAQKTDRRTPVDIEESSCYYDEITLQLPNGYSVEHSPEAKTISSEFGSYITTIEPNGNGLIIKQTLKLNKAVYPKEKYTDFIAFLNSIADANKGKVIVKK